MNQRRRLLLATVRGAYVVLLLTLAILLVVALSVIWFGAEPDGVTGQIVATAGTLAVTMVFLLAGTRAVLESDKDDS